MVHLCEINNYEQEFVIYLIVTIIKKWKQLKYLGKDEQIKKM